MKLQISLCIYASAVAAEAAVAVTWYTSAAYK